MKDTAISMEGISKQYHIGKRQAKYQTLRETLVDSFKSPFIRASKILRGQATGATGLDETLWALKDISLEIKHGEVVGIIGRNGAGKSTLLKVLSRITEPTSGNAQIRGRIGSLLEVGTGFHPELTGRENLYLNGAILGMRRTEIDRKFDDIVAFAEVEKFIDTPVKHYSSGMYLRLAFAVAAYLETEVMLVDEVLAVGDARFQKKCMSKMAEVGKAGRTVLFVSHNMPSITRLCQRAILIDNGQVKEDGAADKVVSAYMRTGACSMSHRTWKKPRSVPGAEVARLLSVRVVGEDFETRETVEINKPVGIEMEYEVLKPDYRLLPIYHFYNEDGVLIFVAHETDPAWRKNLRSVGTYKTIAWIPGNLLSEGMLFVHAIMITLSPDITQFFEKDAVAFQVIESSDENTARGVWSLPMKGVVRPLLDWHTQPVLNV